LHLAISHFAIPAAERFLQTRGHVPEVGAPSADAAGIETRLRSLAELRHTKADALIHATRVSVTGRAVSAGLFDVLVLLGPARVSRRLRRAAAYAAEA